jgi:nucleoid-associated protein YgaU
VLVKPGDSLWLITAQRLGPTATDGQIAVGWPYWYRRNRPVIGRDPNLLRPGQRLAVPTPEGKA